MNKKSIILVVSLVGLLGAASLASRLTILGQARANQPSDSRRCSTHTLKGSYGIKFEGRKVTGEPIASVSRITFDGTGVFTTQEIGRLNGVLFERSFTGPYTVNDDCTGFLDFSSNLTDPPHPVHGDFVIVNEGEEFFVLDNEDNWAATGVGKKL